MAVELVWVKHGGAVKQVNLAKAKRLVHEGYEIGKFVKGVWEAETDTDTTKQNRKLKSDNKIALAKNESLATENAALKAELEALKSKSK